MPVIFKKHRIMYMMGGRVLVEEQLGGVVRGSEVMAAELFEFAKHIARRQREWFAKDLPFTNPAEYHRGIEAYQGAQLIYQGKVQAYGLQVLLEAQEAIWSEEEAGAGGAGARGGAGGGDGGGEAGSGE